jgi:RNA polymerase sigma-70 factor (ECF subfamily)
MRGTVHKGLPSFDEVYDVLFPVIYRVSLRVTGDKEAAEDLCHEAFIKFMGRSSALPDLEQSKFWLIRVVKNLSLNYEKKRIRERAAYSRLTHLSTGTAESGESVLLREEARSGVQAALNCLPYNLRAPLVFREYAGLSYKEIGALLGISENNVKVRVFRARERLGKIFMEEKLYVS